MATLDKAEALLEELRVASVDAARRDLDEVTAFAAEQARSVLCVIPSIAILHISQDLRIGMGWGWECITLRDLLHVEVTQ